MGHFGFERGERPGELDGLRVMELLCTARVLFGGDDAGGKVRPQAAQSLVDQFGVLNGGFGIDFSLLS
jgi:hypothetical protein